MNVEEVKQIVRETIGDKNTVCIIWEGGTDLRKRRNNLVNLVKRYGYDPYQNEAFIFCNWHKTKAYAFCWRGSDFAETTILLDPNKVYWPGIEQRDVHRSRIENYIYV